MPRLKITDLPRSYQEQVGAQIYAKKKTLDSVVDALHGEVVEHMVNLNSSEVYAEAQFTGCPAPLTEYKFHPTRKWRFDYYWPKEKVALEVEGAVWVQGRHTRGSGFIKDMEKYNEASAMGIRVLRCTPQQLKKGEILPVLKRALGITTEL